MFTGAVGTRWIVGETRIDGGGGERRGGDAITTTGSIQRDTGGTLPGLSLFGNTGMVVRRSRCGEGSDGCRKK